MPNAADPNATGDLLPRPDPTVLTTQALRDSEQTLLRAMHERVASLRELLEQRLDGMDEATRLLASQLAQIPEASNLRFTVQRGDILAQLDSVKQLVEQRLDGMDKATELLAATVGRVPSETDKAVGGLRELLGARIDGMDVATKLLAASVEKFPSDIDRSSINTREYLLSLIKQVESVSIEKFSAIEGTFASNALALTAALAAQKEAAAEQNKSNTLAIAKSEQATKETISSNATQTANSLASQAANIADLKDRVVRIESGGVATSAAHTEQRLTINQIVAVLAIVASVAIGILLATRKLGDPEGVPAWQS